MPTKQRAFLLAGIALIAVHTFAGQPSPVTTIEPASTAQRVEVAQAEPPPDQGLFDRETLTGDWWGHRTALEDRGVSVGFAFYGDIFQNLRGGVNTADMDFMHLESLTLTLDSEKLFNYTGGTFFMDLQHIGGDNPSDNVGDWQWVSSIASERRDQLAEIWYEQKLLDDQVRIKLGKIDAAYDFDVSEVGSYFSNNSSLQSPTLPGFVTYPDPAFGIIGEYSPCDRFYVRGALFDGTQQEGKTLGDDGARTVFKGPSDLLLIGEVGTSWKAGHLPGRVAVGMTYHTGTFDRFDGGTDDGVAGYYLVAEHMLVKENVDDDEDVQGTGIFFRAGLTDGDTQDVVYHLGGGIVFAGFIPSRDSDSAGFAANVVGFTDEADFHGDELNLELFYQIQVTKFFSIAPDLQYIFNPSGDDSLDDAIALGLRLQLAF